MVTKAVVTKKKQGEKATEKAKKNADGTTEVKQVKMRQSRSLRSAKNQ